MDFVKNVLLRKLSRTFLAYNEFPSKW